MASTISWVGGQAAGRTNASAATTVNFTTAPQAGDLVVITCVTGSAAGNPTMAVASGNYTNIGQLNQSAATADTSMDTSYKIMQDPPDTNFTIPGTTNNAWGEAYSVQTFRGVDAAVMDVTPVPGGATGTGRPNPEAINWSTAGTWVVICGGGAAGTGANYVAPANYTTNFLTATGTDNTDAMVGSGYRSDPADPEDPAVYTGGTTGATDSWCSYTLALRLRPQPALVGGSNDCALSFGGDLSVQAAAIPVQQYILMAPMMAIA